MQLSHNTVLITGGATGIGYAMAEAFLEAGNTVIICGRREERLREAHARHPALHTRVCDVADAADRSGLVDWVSTRFSDLNVLVNNAGVQRDVDFTQGLGEFLAGENEIRVNLEAPIILSGLFVPLLARNKGAAIVNVSSGLGFVPAVRMPVYSASKAGLHAFSMAIRPQLSKIGITLFEVVPPAVDTELNPAGRARRPNFKPDLEAKVFVAAVMTGLENDVCEIGFGMSAGFIRASREDLDKCFQQMNGRM
jgi:uncharacterized oxidoreductase